MRYGLSRFDLEPEDQRRRKAAAAAVLQRIDKREREKEIAGVDDGSAEYDERFRRPRKEDLVLNQYEQTIATEVVAPDDIAVKFNGRRPSTGDFHSY